MPSVPTLESLFHVLKAETVFNVFRVEGNDGFTLAHDGENHAGVAEDATIYVQLGDSEVIADPGPGANKIKLIVGRVVFVPGGPYTFTYIAAAGTPTFTVARRR